MDFSAFNSWVHCGRLELHSNRNCLTSHLYLPSICSSKDSWLLQVLFIKARLFTGRTDAEAPILWPPDVKSWFIGKDSDPGKDWGQKKGVTEDEMVGLHHWLNGLEFEQTVGDSEGQGSLACCSPWGHKELDTSNWTTESNHLPGSDVLEKIVFPALTIALGRSLPAKIKDLIQKGVKGLVPLEKGDSYAS